MFHTNLFGGGSIISAVQPVPQKGSTYKQQNEVASAITFGPKDLFTRRHCILIGNRIAILYCGHELTVRYQRGGNYSALKNTCVHYNTMDKWTKYPSCMFTTGQFAFSSIELLSSP